MRQAHRHGPPLAEKDSMSGTFENIDDAAHPRHFAVAPGETQDRRPGIQVARLEKVVLLRPAMADARPGGKPESRVGTGAGADARGRVLAA